jgi:hypothetical protein
VRWIRTRRQRGDAGQRGGAGGREVDAGGLARDRVVLGDHDQLGPGAVVHRRIGVAEEPVDLVAGRVARHAGADLLDDARVVAAEHDGELVLDHALEHPAGDGGVDGVDRGRVDTHEHLAVGGGGGGVVVAQRGWRVEAGEGEGSHADNDRGPSTIPDALRSLG